MENKVKFWLARDKDGKLFVHFLFPDKKEDRWVLDWDFLSVEIDSSLFPSVKWEDDKPTAFYTTLDEPQEQLKQEQPTPKQEIDWEQRRYEIAKEMMLELYRQKAVVKTHVQVINPKDIAHFAVAFADILIKELKEKSE